MKVLQAIRWAITFLFVCIAFLNLCAGDRGAVFYAVFALISLPHYTYQRKWRELFPSSAVRFAIAAAAVLISVIIQPGFSEASPEESAPYNIGYKLGAAVYDITKLE